MAEHCSDGAQEIITALLYRRRITCSAENQDAKLQGTLALLRSRAGTLTTRLMHNDVRQMDVVRAVMPRAAFESIFGLGIPRDMEDCIEAVRLER